MSTAIDGVYFLVLYLSIALSITQDLFLILLNQKRREDRTQAQTGYTAQLVERRSRNRRCLRMLT